MRIDTSAPGAATITSPVPASTLSSGPPLAMPRLLRRVPEVLGDLLALVGIVFCIPFVILAIGTPIALFVRLALWILDALMRR